MGKEDKGRQLDEGAKVGSTGKERRVFPEERLSREELRGGQGKAEDARGKEAEIERAIEEMLQECQHRATEDFGRDEKYKPGDERKGRKRPVSFSDQVPWTAPCFWQSIFPKQYRGGKRSLPICMPAAATTGL